MKTNISKRTLKLFLLLGLILSLIFSITLTSQAASKKTKALKAYKKMLSQTTIDRDGWPIKSANCSFATAYIDNDNIPELILYNNQDVPHMGSYGTLFTYRKGKVQFVTTLDLDSTREVGYYKKKNLYVSYYYTGGEVTNYVKFKKGTTTAFLAKSRRLVGLKLQNPQYYKSASAGASTKISKKQFTKFLKNYVGNTKMTKFKFHENTAKNRSKYIY